MRIARRDLAAMTERSTSCSGWELAIPCQPRRRGLNTACFGFGSGLGLCPVSEARVERTKSYEYSVQKQLRKL